MCVCGTWVKNCSASVGSSYYYCAELKSFGVTYSDRQEKTNSRLSVKEIDKFCVLDTASENLLKQAISRLNLSARAYHRILKVARTIADLSGIEKINNQHIAEAIQYRRLDKN